MANLHDRFLNTLKITTIQLETISGESYHSIYYKFMNFVYVIKLEKKGTQGFDVAYITFSWSKESIGKPLLTYSEINADNFKERVMSSLECNPTIRLHLLF